MLQLRDSGKRPIENVDQKACETLHCHQAGVNAIGNIEFAGALGQSLAIEILPKMGCILFSPQLANGGRGVEEPKRRWP